MKLTTHERLMLRLFVPPAGGIITLKVGRDILKKVEFTDKEIELLGMYDNPKGGVSWSLTKAKEFEPFEIKFTKPELEVLRERIDAMDKEKSIPFEAYDLVMKFKS